LVDTDRKAMRWSDHGRGEKAEAIRRSFTDEFKAGAVRLAVDEGKTVSEVARDLGLDRVQRCALD